MTIARQTTTKNLYEQDYYLWIEETLAILKTRQLDRLDIDNLIEEIEGMSASEKRSIKSNLKVILMHLLKYAYQPEHRTNSWRYTLIEHRQGLDDDFKTSPSLRRYFLQEFDDCYRSARKLASVETEIAISIFPQNCPFTPEQVLDEDFYPEN